MYTKKKTPLLFLALLLVLGLTVMGCGQTGAPAANQPTPGSSEPASAENYDDITITYGMSAPWEKIQPFNISVSGWYGGLIIDKIFDSLTYTRSDGTFTPRNAKEWSIAPDGKTITFKLDEKATWHDGEKVTAEDWVFTFQTVTKADFPVADQGNYSIYEGTSDSGVELSPNSIRVEATDPYTFVVHLKQGISLEEYLLDVPQQYHVLPKHILETVPAAELMNHAFWQNPIGSGPFKFVSETAGNTVELSANKDYYLGAPKFGRLVFKQIAPANLATSLLAGEIDYLYTQLSTDDALLLKGSPGIEVVRAANPTGWVAIMINNQLIPDARIRQALNYAVDKQDIVNKLYQGEAQVSANYIIPTSKYYDKSLNIGRDVEKAKTLLAEAGWDQDRVITIAVPAGIRERIATIVQQNFAEVGVKLELLVVDPPTMYAGLTEGKFEMGFSGYSATLDPLHQASLFFNDRVTFIHVSDPWYREMYNRISTEVDEDIRFDLLWEWQAYIDEEQPLINLLHSYKYSCYSSRLSNFNPDESDLWNEAVWEWEVAR
jgi:peptide/nickel transport system substrate-binding protein